MKKNFIKILESIWGEDVILEKVIENHRLGSHCGTTSLAVVSNFYGHKFSEAMTFGLGSGIGFTYQKYAETDFYFFTGRNESLDINLTNLLGGNIEVGSSDDKEQGFLAVKEFIDNGIPVILDLNVMHLPYFNQYMKDLGNVSFGLHNAVMVGYDLEKKVAYLLDHRWSEVIEISLDQLAEARCSKNSPVNPRNGYKAIVLPNYESDLNYEIEQAIKINIHRMKYPFAFKMGLDGIKMFSKECKRWGDVLTEKEKIETSKMATVFLEKLGTGGGNFRRMYSRFLKEASKITGEERFIDVSKDYMKLFHKWREVIGYMEASSLDVTKGIFSKEKEVDNTLQSIVELEFEAIRKLEDIVKY